MTARRDEGQEPAQFHTFGRASAAGLEGPPLVEPMTPTCEDAQTRHGLPERREGEPGSRQLGGVEGSGQAGHPEIVGRRAWIRLTANRCDQPAGIVRLCTMTDLTALHIPGRPLVLVNVWDAGSARAVAATGVPALATASWAVAAAHGYPDGEQLPRETLLATLREITAAVEVPVTVDLEAGYGASAEEVAETVTAAIEAGAAGCNLEDGVDGTRLRPVEDMVDRLRAARAAAEAAGVAFHLNARTDVWLLPADAVGAGDTDEALRRLSAYARAGADSAFVPGLGLGVALDRVVAQQPLPVNVMRGTPDDPPTSALAAAGVARISHGPGAWLHAMASLTAFADAAVQG